MTPFVYTAHSGEIVSIVGCLAQAVAGSELHVVAPRDSRITIVDDASSERTLKLFLVVESHAQVLFSSSVVVASGQVERVVTVCCSGVGGKASLVFACQTSNDGVFNLQTVQQHTASHSESSVTIKGVSENNSRATVSSTIYIAPHIAGIVADQVHKHLLLEQGARAVSVPALDILSDDVSCSHGSAITHLDEQQMFYLKARGYDSQMARDAIVKAFLAI